MGYIIVLFIGLVLVAFLILGFSKSGTSRDGEGTLPKDESGSGGTGKEH